MTVASAHRSPERVTRLVADALVSGASRSSSSGPARRISPGSWPRTPPPVIGVPIDSSALKGLDLLSTVQMPPGVPVATVSIGKPGATNAGVLAAQIIAVGNPEVAGRVAAYKKTLAEKVEAAAKLPENTEHKTPSTSEVTVLTFGCRVNQADSLRLEEQLQARGAGA